MRLNEEGKIPLLHWCRQWIYTARVLTALIFHVIWESIFDHLESELVRNAKAVAKLRKHVFFKRATGPLTRGSSHSGTNSSSDEEGDRDKGRESTNALDHQGQKTPPMNGTDSDKVAVDSRADVEGARDMQEVEAQLGVCKQLCVDEEVACGGTELLDAEWRVASDVVQPGSASGTSAQKS